MDDATPIDALLAQGCCCGSGCENCPYLDEAGSRHMAGTVNLNQPWIDFKNANPDKTYQDWQGIQAAKTA